MVDLVKLNNEPIELTTGFLDDILQLLKEAHDKMDDFNASEYGNGKCEWCEEFSYDGQGLIHDDNCILIKIRHVIHV